MHSPMKHTRPTYASAAKIRMQKNINRDAVKYISIMREDHLDAPDRRRDHLFVYVKESSAI